MEEVGETEWGAPSKTWGSPLPKSHCPKESLQPQQEGAGLLTGEATAKGRGGQSRPWRKGRLGHVGGW